MQKKSGSPAYAAERRHLKGLAAANRVLKREIVQRRKVEAALKKSEAHYALP